MINLTLLVLLISVIAIETLVQFLARMYYENKNKLYLAFTAWSMYLGVIFILVSMYDYDKLGLINALWDSGTIVTLALVGYFYFGETFNTGEIVGLCLVVIGALTMGISSTGKEENEIL